MKCFGRSSRRAFVTVSFLLSMLIGWQADAIGAQLNLTWFDSSTDEAGFAVERSTGTTGTFAEIARTGSGVTAYTDSSVAAATTYCYRVRAFTAVAYSDYSNLACSTPGLSFGLSVVKLGLGSGTVTSTPAGINCGTSCAGSYASGTTVTLTAAPATGSTFTGWSGGGCSGTGTCTVAATGATTLTATFALQSATALNVTPQSLTFAKTVGQPNPPAQTVTVTAAAGQVWTTHDNMSFADITGQPYNGSDGVTGTGSGTFQVVPKSGMAALAPGVYNGSITVSTAGFANVVIPVKVTVSASTSPVALSVVPPSLTFTKTVGQPNPPAQTVTVTAAAGHVWTTHDSMAFANITGLPYNGSDGVNGTGPGTFQVVPSKGMTTLAAGVYNGSITVSTAGFANIVIPVKVTVSASTSPTALSVVPPSLTFTKTVGQPNPPAQTVTVTAAGGQIWTTHDSMAFANITGLPYNGSDGVIGTGPGSFQAVPSSGMTTLPPGVYGAFITVSAAGVPNIVIPVQVIVLSSTPPTPLSVAPPSLTFTKTVAQPNPPAQTVTVTAAAGQVWTTHDGMVFAAVTGLPFKGFDGVTGTGPGTFQVVPSKGMTTMAAGVHNGSITVSMAGLPDIVISVQAS